ncbi:SIS domain-containing protein [Nanoarchaeota archaeon]
MSRKIPQKLENFSDQIEDATYLGKKIIGFKNILVCGMGGSAISGDILQSYLDTPVFVAREEVPKFINKDTLAFIISYSGNTKETIKMFNQAKKRKAKIVVIASGGYLGKQKGAIKIPGGYSPREALAYCFFPILNIIGKKKDVGSVISAIKKVNPKEAQKVAKLISKKIPVIHAGSEKLKSAAYRWQTQLNENSKIMAHSSYFDELNHNEIEAKDLNKFSFIELGDEKRASDKFFKPYKLKLKGSTLLAKIFYAIHFGDYVSYYLSRIKKVKYWTNPKIDYIKKNA